MCLVIFLTSRLVLTCYKNSPQKDPKGVPLRNVHFCLKTLILDVSRSIKFGNEQLQLLKRHGKV